MPLARGLKWRTGNIYLSTLFYNTSLIFFFILRKTLTYIFTLVCCVLLYSSIALTRASKLILSVVLGDAVVVLALLLVDTVDFPSAPGDLLLCRRVVSERWH